MSIQTYTKAIELMRSYPSLCDFLGPCSEDLVRQAEQKLNLIFPETYRRFLLEYGAGSFGAEEIYGVFQEDFEKSQTPDAVWFTLTTRREVDFPSSYVIIYSVGDGEVFCIKTDGPVPNQIVAFIPGVPVSMQRVEVIADDFSDFLLEKVTVQLKRHTNLAKD